MSILKDKLYEKIQEHRSRTSKLVKEYGDKVLIAKVNTDDNPEWMMKYGIQGIPTMLFISGGKIVHRQVGALPERMLRDVVSQFLEVIQQA